jgi:hypothetical protein
MWTDVSEEHIAFFFRVEKSENFFTAKMEAISSSETPVYTISTRRHIPEYGILIVCS